MDETEVLAARAAAVRAAVDRVRAIEGRMGATRAALAAMIDALQPLAAAAHLFPPEEFPAPPPGVTGGRRHILHEDPGGRLSLSLAVLAPGTPTLPHDHRTWAVIVAVEGEERNRVYARRAGGLALVREVVVRPGTGLALMPDDIHAVEAGGAAPTRCLHLYGRALETLAGRMAYDPATGAAARCDGAAQGLPPVPRHARAIARDGASRFG
jgi:predicted metal-dependent enzyme (double-stranded beta helix superfamily)